MPDLREDRPVNELWKASVEKRLEHPEWFRARPDGTIQYAENPPKKYQDIYPFDFETEHWQSLCDELLSIVLFWAEQGVRAFRIDNPHTKPYRFWEWLIHNVKRVYPKTIFLSEAFTKQSADQENTLLVIVKLDPYHKHSGWVDLPLETLGLAAQRPYQMHDLLGDGRYLWNGRRNYIELDPQVAPAQIFRIRRQVRTERQFEYFM